MEALRIIFMGTPQFAVPSLKILVEAGYDLVAVITAPDKPKGRGRQLLKSAVKEYAETKGIPVLQPTNLKSPEFIEDLSSLGANLQVVVAFRMLPQVVWEMPVYGTFNLHASMLPDYRGAAPIHWAIINGETETGVTTFFIKQEIDTGSIILQDSEPIAPLDTTGSLSNRLMLKGANLVLKTVQLIASGNYELIPQDLSLDTPKAPKLFRENCEIDWNKSAVEIVNFVRGLNPFPSAWTTINETVYKIHQVKALNDQSTAVLDDQSTAVRVGEFDTNETSYLHFETGSGMIAIEEIQAPGKRKMAIGDFLRGNTL